MQLNLLLSWCAYFGITAHFKVVVGMDLINGINDTRSANLLTKLVTGQKAVRQH